MALPAWIRPLGLAEHFVVVWVLAALLAALGTPAAARVVAVAAVGIAHGLGDGDFTKAEGAPWNGILRSACVSPRTPGVVGSVRGVDTRGTLAARPGWGRRHRARNSRTATPMRACSQKNAVWPRGLEIDSVSARTCLAKSTAGPAVSMRSSHEKITSMHARTCAAARPRFPAKDTATS